MLQMIVKSVSFLSYHCEVKCVLKENPNAPSVWHKSGQMLGIFNQIPWKAVAIRAIVYSQYQITSLKGCIMEN